jgi:hypothetical protein
LINKDITGNILTQLRGFGLNLTALGLECISGNGIPVGQLLKKGGQELINKGKIP